MKTTKFQIENDKATAAYDLLYENEFFNFDMVPGDFRTAFVFENLTPEEELIVSDVFDSCN